MLCYAGVVRCDANARPVGRFKRNGDTAPLNTIVKVLRSKGVRAGKYSFIPNRGRHKKYARADDQSTRL